MARVAPSAAGGNNVLAFLDMLAFSEIGAPLLAASDDGYNIIVGSTPARPIIFHSYADHPRQLIVLNAGLKSTAAGRYQFLAHIWDDVRAKTGLRGFDPVSQDLGAIELLRERGAIQHIQAGTISKAMEIAVSIALDSKIWASLPGANYGQHENKMLDLLRAYGAALAKYESIGEALGI